MRKTPAIKIITMGALVYWLNIMVKLSTCTTTILTYKYFIIYYKTKLKQDKEKINKFNTIFHF